MERYLAVAWTQQDLDRLDKAIATGAREVQFRDQRTVFRSLREMKELRADIARTLAVGQGKRTTRQVRTVVSRGR